MTRVEISYGQHTDIVTENFKSFLENETYIDLIFVCANNRKVGAHQIVMGCLSKFLSNLLIQNQNETKDKIIYIYVPDIRARIMKHILKFVYTGKVMVNREELGEFNDDLIVLGMPLSVITSVNKGQPNIPAGCTQTANTPIPPSYPSKDPIPSISMPQNDTNLRISNVESLNASTFNSSSVYAGVMNTSRFLNQPDRLMPMTAMNPNPSSTSAFVAAPSLTPTKGPQISAEVMSSPSPRTSTAFLSTTESTTENPVKSPAKGEKRRKALSNSGKKSLKIDQCINLAESDEDNDIITIT